MGYEHWVALGNRAFKWFTRLASNQGIKEGQYSKHISPKVTQGRLAKSPLRVYKSAKLANTSYIISNSIKGTTFRNTSYDSLILNTHLMDYMSSLGDNKESWILCFCTWQLQWQVRLSMAKLIKESMKKRSYVLFILGSKRLEWWQSMEEEDSLMVSGHDRIWSHQECNKLFGNPHDLPAVSCFCGRRLRGLAWLWIATKIVCWIANKLHSLVICWTQIGSTGHGKFFSLFAKG